MSSANMHLLLGHTHLLSLLFFIEHKHSDYRFHGIIIMEMQGLTQESCIRLQDRLLLVTNLDLSA